MSTNHLLEVQDLSISFAGEEPVHALNGVSFHVDAGECLAVLGESGSGKSLTAQAIMGILPRGLARIGSGRVLLDGEDLLTMSESRRTGVRGGDIGMVFQDALTALNPVYKVGTQITEAYRLRRGVSKRAARRRAIELLDLVRVPDARARVDQYPHELSGGLRQRVMIAAALALDPRLLIADEPTTALDVTVQAEIMDLLDEIRREAGMGMMLISHDMGVVSGTADRVAIMYGGRIVEEGGVHDVFTAAAHPYTQALLRSTPDIDVVHEEQFYIAGTPPVLHEPPNACSFRFRCPLAHEACEQEVPPALTVGPGHRAECVLAEKVATGVEAVR